MTQTEIADRLRHDNAQARKSAEIATHLKASFDSARLPYRGEPSITVPDPIAGAHLMAEAIASILAEQDARIAALEAWAHNRVVNPLVAAPPETEKG
jgi:hypothetical protein